MTNTSKNPVVRAAAGAAVLLVGLAGCASKASTSATSAVGDGTGTSVVTTAPTSGSSATSLPSSAASTTAPAAPHETLPIMTLPPVGGGSPKPSGSLSPGEQVKYSTPVGVSVSKDGTQVSASVEWGGCTQQPQLIVISQDSGKVVVELKTVSFYRLGVMCPDIARIGEADLTLSPPLGGRLLVDGITHAVIQH